MLFEIKFQGHKNILANHAKTIEITKDTHLSIHGDCIIGTCASHACLDIPDELKKQISNNTSRIMFVICVDDMEFKIHARGSDQLTLTNPNDIVIRMSNFICPRTIAIGSDHASNTIPKQLIQRLQNPETLARLQIHINDSLST